MISTISTKIRPLRLAYLVDPNSPTQVREAIRLSSSLWGGSHCPIVQLHKRLPKTWANKPLKRPSAESVVLGYLDAFDPDFLVQFAEYVPDYVKATGRKIVAGESIWQRSDSHHQPTPCYGVGIFEILSGIFEKHFRHVSKYPTRLAIPRIPKKMCLFWASLFGELPASLIPCIDSDFRNALEIEDIDVEPSRFKDALARDILFPRRIVSWQLSPKCRSGFFRYARVFFLDATKVDDIIDFWNLRAIGHDAIPVPKQFATEPGMQEFVVEFMKS